MKPIFVLIVLAATPAVANTLPSEKRKNGPLIQEALSPVQIALQESSAAFYNNETSSPFLYGTVVSKDGLILTKASELEQVKDFHVRVGTKKYREPKVLGSDEVWDVALVRIEAEGLTPVKMGETAEFPHGTWVVSNGSTERRFRRPRPGIISANKREVPVPGGVVLGVELKEEKGGLVIGKITENSGAEKAGLQPGDLIVGIGESPVKKRADLIKKFKDEKEGNRVLLKVKRGEEELSIEVELMSREKLYGRQMTRNDQLSGGDLQQSDRRTGFPMIIQHETMLTRYEVGGPVFTLDQQFVGMNIAAVNRVEAFAIPSEELPDIVAELKKSAQ
jgi:serine protease Do